MVLKVADMKMRGMRLSLKNQIIDATGDMKRTMISKKINYCSILYISLLIVLPGIISAEQTDKKTIAPVASTTGDIASIGTLDLETAQKITLSKNPSIEAAQARIVQAQERVKQARAAYMPTITANASASRIGLSDSGYQSLDPPNNQNDNPDNVYTTGLTAKWTLFDGFERNYNTAAARFGMKASIYAQKEIHRLLKYNVAESFYNAVSMRENIAIITANEKYYQRLKDEAEKRLQTGTGSLSDQLSLDVQLNSVKNDLIQAKHDYQVAMLALAEILGVAPVHLPVHLQLADLQPELPQEMVCPEIQPLISTALANRSDLNQRISILNQIQQSVKSVNASFFPTIDLSATLDGERRDGMAFTDDDFGNTLMFNLSYDLFTGGEKSARLKERQSKARQAQKELDQIKLAVRKQVRQAHFALQMSQEQLSLQRENAVLVKKNRDLIEKEYLAGQNSLVRLNEAQKDKIAAQCRLAQSLVSLRLAWENLNACVGDTISKTMFKRVFDHSNLRGVL
jgi:outer membrane protein TolC